MGIFSALLPFTRGDGVREEYDASAGAMVEHLSRVGRWIPVSGIDLYLGAGARLHGFAAGPRYEMTTSARVAAWAGAPAAYAERCEAQKHAGLS